MKPLQIFIGFDPAESAAYYTMCNSIRKRATFPVSITPLDIRNLSRIFWRDRDPLQSNEFSFVRFLVPWLCDYQGTAVFMDCDMLILDDIGNLFAHAQDQYAVSVVKHNHVPEEEVKYLGAVQTKYPRKNWSSVMLFNNAKCTALTPEYVANAPGLDLHGFKWIEDEMIGELPLAWNFLVNYYEDRPVDCISNLHYTEGGPYFHEYRDCPYADVWWKEYDDMRNTAQGAKRLTHFSEVAEKVG